MADVIGHRGWSGRYLDNSWPGIRAAYAAGAEACEVDLQALRCGRVVACHEYMLAGVRVADLSWERFASLRPEAPTLEALLEWASERGFPVLLEVKDRRVLPGLVAAARGFWGGVWVGSFDGPCLRRLRELAPEARTSLMVGTVVEAEVLASLALRYGCRGVHPCWESRSARPHELLSRGDVVALQGAGLRVTLWHEERPDELLALLDLGVDAICTNTPDVLLRLREARAAGVAAGPCRPAARA